MFVVPKTLFGRRDPHRTPAKHPAVLPVEALADRMNSRRLGARVPWKGYSGPDTREAFRFVPDYRKTYLQLSSGQTIPAEIVNLSHLAVAVQASLPEIAFDSVTAVGMHPVRKGRSMLRGCVFLFERPLRPKSCGPAIVL